MEITVRDYIDGKYPDKSKIYINTFNGKEPVIGIRWPETNPWIVVEYGQGHTRSYCVHYGDILIAE